MTPRSLALLTLVPVVLGGGAALGAPVPTLAPGDLHPGEKAVVRTVFQGTRVESFDAEIVGVLHGGRAEGDMILARATSPRVVESGVAQGMSGSPVYVDGKLIGALSSGWSFSKQPLFGITPIGEMLDVLKLPTGADAEGTAGPAGAGLGDMGAGVRYDGFRWSDDPPPAVAPPTLAEGPRPLPLPLATSGLAPAAVEPLARALTPLGFSVVPGGSAADGGPAPDSLEPGSAVAVDVMRGDLQLSAIGTVTWRDGDRVLLFGHPFFQAGEVRLPMSTAEITTIVASQANSFKLGVRGRPAGTVIQDRRTAVAGRVGPSPHLLPVRVRVEGGGQPRRVYSFQSIEDRTLAPTLLGIAAVNSLLESGGSGGNHTLRWTMTLHRPGVAPLALTGSTASDTPPAELLSGLSSPLRFLFANPYQRLGLDSVAIDVRVEPATERWTLTDARLATAAVRPGGRVRVTCGLDRWRGGSEERTFEVQVPEEAPDGRYLLLIGGGAEVTRYEAQHLPGRFRPTSLDDAWSRLAHLRSPDGLYAALLARAPEVTSEGRDYPELPLSALALMASGQSAGDEARRGDTAWLDEVRLPLDGAIRGELLLQVQVDSKAP